MSFDVRLVVAFPPCGIRVVRLIVHRLDAMGLDDLLILCSLGPLALFVHRFSFRPLAGIPADQTVEQAIIFPLFGSQGNSSLPATACGT